jgi:hypothetical protein
LHSATRKINDTTNRHGDTAEDLQVREATIISGDERAANRRAGQGSYRDSSEEAAVSDANLADVGDLGDEGWCEGNESARGEAVEGGEDDDGDVAVGGEPEGKDYDGGEGIDYDHGVKAAETVGDDTGEDTAEDTAGSISQRSALCRQLMMEVTYLAALRIEMR